MNKCPLVVMNGDFNFSNMRSWNIEEINDLRDSTDNRISAGRAIASDREQELLLCDTMDKWFLSQCMVEATREKNVLDLFLVSDHEIVRDIKVVTNVKLSDHTTNIVELNLNKDKVKTVNRNFFYTKVADYDIEEATNEEWGKY